MFGDRLKELREEKNYTQDDLAEILHVKRQTVSSWENEITKPTLETLVVLADLFEVSTDYLLGRTKQRENLHTIPNKGLIMEIALLLSKYNIKKKD